MRHGLTQQGRPRSENPELAADLRNAGVPEDQIAAYLASRGQVMHRTDYEVWPENEAALDLWAAVEGRWVFVMQGWAAPMGGMMIESVPAGLDMQAVAICAAALGRPLDRASLADLSLMEREALQVLSEQRARRR